MFEATVQGRSGGLDLERAPALRRVDERAAFSILDRHAEVGGAWIDTSDNDSFWMSDTGFGGQSEALLGRWLAANPGPRVRLNTKFGAQPTQVGGFSPPDHRPPNVDPASRDPSSATPSRLIGQSAESHPRPGSWPGPSRVWARGLSAMRSPSAVRPLQRTSAPASAVTNQSPPAMWSRSPPAIAIPTRRPSPARHTARPSSRKPTSNPTQIGDGGDLPEQTGLDRLGDLQRDQLVRQGGEDGVLEDHLGEQDYSGETSDIEEGCGQTEQAGASLGDRWCDRGECGHDEERCHGSEQSGEIGENLVAMEAVEQCCCSLTGRRCEGQAEEQADGEGNDHN